MAVEADIKALDKRVGGIERKLDELDKSLRAAGDFKALEARVKALEQICKVLMEARTESKSTAARMLADVAVLTRQSMTSETVDKMLEQQRKVGEAQSIAQAKASIEAARALAEKTKADVEANVLKTVEKQFKTVVETRLVVLEKMVQQLGR